MTLTQLPLDQQIKIIVEGRVPGEKQIEFAIYLIDAGVLSGAQDAANYIEAKREFDRMQREASTDPVKRVPVAQQIINALQTLRDEGNELTPDTYADGVNDSISVAGRYV